MMTEFSAPKSVVMNIKLPKQFLHLFANGALFLLSFFFIYFSLSSHLFNHTNFWFFLSNTLVFIVALHSGAFSPPSTAKTNPTSPQHNFNNTILLNQLPNSPIPTHTQEEDEEIITPLPTEISIPPKINNPIKPYQRSKSEKDMKQVTEKAKKMKMKRSKTMTRQKATWSKEKEVKEKEFREMTDEELNKRVEEFIERFNRQIRVEQMKEDEKESF